MSVWHEAIAPDINHVLPSRDGRVRAVIRRRDHLGGVNTVHFMRWQGEGKPTLPRLDPSAWVELWPREEVSAKTLGQAKALARAVIEQIGDRPMDTQFEARPYQPIRFERVAEIDQPGGKVKALVGKRQNGPYEVRYFSHQLLGVWSKDNTEEWDWVRTRWEVATFADTLAEAERAARRELDELTETRTQPTVQDWFAWVGENSSPR